MSGAREKGSCVALGVVVEVQSAEELDSWKRPMGHAGRITKLQTTTVCAGLHCRGPAGRLTARPLNRKRKPVWAGLSNLNTSCKL